MVLARYKEGCREHCGSTYRNVRAAYATDLTCETSGTHDCPTNEASCN